MSNQETLPIEPGIQQNFDAIVVIVTNPVDHSNDGKQSAETVVVTEIQNLGAKNKKTPLKAIFVSIIFTVIIMVAAILIVCLTASELSDLCEANFKPVLDENLYQYNSNPRALVTGDLNKDNFLDIVVVNSVTDSIGIFLNKGDGSFASQMTFDTGVYSSPISTVLGDFNHDTYLDIAVANYHSNSIGIFLGDGNGSFTNQYMISTDASRPISLAVGDLDNDYNLDIVITNNGTNDIIILFGYGDGSFGNQMRYSTDYDSLPYFVVINDFNHDNRLDIVVANYGTNNIGIFLGYGNRSFTSQIVYSTGLQSNPYAIAVNDLNDDKQLDLVVANSRTNNVGIFLGYGNGSFTSQNTYTVSPGSRPQSVVIGDVNHDKRLDVIVSNYLTNNISILLGYGNGSFSIPFMHSTGASSAPSGVIYADFNNNNQSDVTVINYGSNNLLVLTAYETVQSQEPTTYTTGIGSTPYGILNADLNNDTNIDLIVVNFGTNNVGVLLGSENGTFHEQVLYSSGNNSHPYGLAVDDLDNDYQLDIVIGNSNTQTLGILYGYGNGNFSTVVNYFTGDGSSIRAVTVNDFNNDNNLDIAFADFGNNGIGVFLGYGNRIFGNFTTYLSQSNSRSISLASGDLNNDGHIDIAVANYGTNNVAIFCGSNNGTFTLFSYYLTGDSSLPEMITIADVNNDHNLDIIVANMGTSIIGVFFGFGNGNFSVQMEYSTGTSSSPVWVIVVDLDHDGCLDLATTNRNVNNVGVLLGDCFGYFGNQTTYSSGSKSRPYSVTAGDFNKDNRLDIAVANYGANNIAVLLGHPNENSVNLTIEANSISNSTNTSEIVSNKIPLLLGDYYATFRNQTLYSTGASFLPYSMAIGDLNNDTEMDLLVANSGTGNIGILLGPDNGTFHVQTFYSIDVSSKPEVIIMDDFDDDGHLDAAVTDPENDNIIVLLGNGNGTFKTKLTYSTDTQSNPSALASGYFNDDNYMDLVVANQGTDTIGIFFGYRHTIFDQQSPYNTGATTEPTAVTVADFNNDGYLDVVTSFYGTDNVGIFLGYGNGTFKLMMSYGKVPSSHPWSVTVGDFNNDNQTDIVMGAWGIGSISIIFGYGNGSFTQPTIYPISSSARPVSVAVDDINNDHYLDIVTANYGGNSIGVFIGCGNGTFQNVTLYPTGTGSSPNSVVIIDINNDTILDIIVASSGIDSVSIFLGYGNGTFANQLLSPTGDKSMPYYAIANDFDKDGRLDLAVANYGTSSLSILYGYGNGTFHHIQTYTTGTGSKPTFVRIGDFNGDNLLDIIVSDEVSTNIGLFYGFTDGTFGSMSIVSLPEGSAIYGIDIGNFNGDNHLDFILADYGNNVITLFLASGNQPFGGQTLISVGQGSQPCALVVGHFNNDRIFDIAVANSGNHNMGILLGRGDRTFSNMIMYSTSDQSQSMSLAIGDLNNDSLVDIVVANSASYNIIIYLGLGNGSFSNYLTSTMIIDSQPTSVAIGHFDRDYQMDIAVANLGTNNIWIFYGDEDITFSYQVYYPIGYDTRPIWVMFKDMNKDGWEDTGVVLYGYDNIIFRLNLC